MERRIRVCASDDCDLALTHTLGYVGYAMQAHAHWGPIVFPRAVSAEICTRINALCMLDPVGTTDTGSAYAGFRIAESRWIERDADREWLFTMIEKIFSHVNVFYQFDYSGVAPRALHAIYRENGHFGWHLDVGAGDEASRKIAVVIQLSEPSTYSGGDIEFSPPDRLAPCRALGTVIAFPAFSAHRVTPVCSGTRQSLVMWAMGPRFK